LEELEEVALTLVRATQIW